MSFPLWDLAKDLAVARSGRGSEVDSDRRYLRGRLAGVTWIPGFGLALLLGGLTGSWIVALVVTVLTLIAMGLIACGPRRVLGLIRGRSAKKAPARLT